MKKIIFLLALLFFVNPIFAASVNSSILDNIENSLYGFTYTMNGDSVVIDFGCKKRKKYIIADFESG